VPIGGQDGIEASKMLAQKEGIFTGISGGSTFAVALDIARNAQPGTVILCMLPDTGERYLSSPLFEDVAEGMDEQEVALSHSTPGFHLLD
jgi:cysteine synthase A